MDIRNVLFFHNLELLFIPIESRVHLLPSRIQHRADERRSPVQTISHRIHRRHMDQRLLERQSQSFRCRRANPKPRKRSWTAGYCDCIDAFQRHLQHFHNLINHRKKCLRMRFFQIHRIFRRDHIIRNNSNRCHQGCAFDSQNSHFLFPPVAGYCSFTEIFR